MSDILEKDKIDQINETNREKEESNSENENYQNEKKRMIDYGSIFKDLLKVNININQIVHNKKEESIIKSEEENDPYSYLYDSYGFVRTNNSFIPESYYFQKIKKKKINKVKPSKVRIVNFYETVRACADYGFHKFRKSTLSKTKRNRLCEERSI